MQFYSRLLQLDQQKRLYLSKWIYQGVGILSLAGATTWSLSGCVTSPCSCSDPAFREQHQLQQHQNGPCSLPPIPKNLVQPLRDALPKIDEALLSSVPTDALPLCQQLFSTWLSTSDARITDIPPPPPPPRAQTTMNIATMCHQSPLSSSSILSDVQPYRQQKQDHIDRNHNQHQLRHRHFAETTTSINTKFTTPKQCRKSQSTSRLPSWISWSLAKRRNGSVAPMVHYQKKSAYQNISDTNVNAKTSMRIYATKPATSTTVPRIDLSRRQPHDSYILQKQLPQIPLLSQQQSVSLRRPPELPQRPQSHQYSQLSHLPSRQAINKNHTRQSHHSLGLSPSLSSSSSTTASELTSSSVTFLSQENNGSIGNYRRSFSFMLSKLGTKVRQVIHSSSQLIHPTQQQHKSPNNTSSNIVSSNLSQVNLPELHNLPLSPLSQNLSLQCLHVSTGSPSMSSSCKLKTSVSVGTMIYDHQAIEENTHSMSPPNGNGSVQQTHYDDNEYSGTHPSFLLGQQYSPISTSSWKEVTYDLPAPEPVSKQQQQPRTQFITDSSSLSTTNDDDDDDEYSDYSEYDSANDQEDDDHAESQHCYITHDSNNTNLKTPWSPPEAVARWTLRLSKTDTNMTKEPSVPFMKMGLGRKCLDDQTQYTARSMSSSSFPLQWQQNFHDQQRPRERIASILKSVSLALYDIVSHNHAYHQFASDPAYVAYPDLVTDGDRTELFAAVPLTNWRDIFDQMAYMFGNGNFTSEHAIITVIYIERMLNTSQQHLCEANWRLIVLAGLITSVKVWDDCAIHNMDFLRIFPELDIGHINLIERRFLEHIDWDVSVRCSLFANTYFELQEN